VGGRSDSKQKGELGLLAVAFAARIRFHFTQRLQQARSHAALMRESLALAGLP